MAEETTKKATINLPPGMTQEQVDKILASHVTRQATQGKRNAAKREASSELAKKYPADYEVFYKKALKARGLEK